MPLPSAIRKDGRRRVGSGDDEIWKSNTVSTKRRGVVGSTVPNANAKAGDPARQSTFDRLAAPKYQVAKKVHPKSSSTALKARSKPLSTRASSGTSAGHMRSNNNTTKSRKALSHDKENQAKGITSRGVPGTGTQAKNDQTKRDQTTKKEPNSTAVDGPSTKKRVTFTQVTKPASVAGNRGNGINSLRRSLRDTITPPSQKTRKSRNKSSASMSSTSESQSTQVELFPNQEYISPPRDNAEDNQDGAKMTMLPSTPLASTAPEGPKTPNSILKHQLNATMDESLLISPSGSFHSLHAYVSPSEEEDPIRSMTENKSGIGSTGVLEDHSTPLTRNTTVPTRRMVVGNISSTQHLPPPPPPHAPVVGSSEIAPNRVVVSMKGSVFSAKKNARSIVKRSSRTPSKPGHPIAVAKGKETLALPYETPCMVQNAAKIMSLGPTVDTPKSKRGKGVCLDLTALFFTEQKTVRKANLQVSLLQQSDCKENQAHMQPTVLEGNLGDTSTMVPTDERWAEMQCETFSKWLNFALDPTEDDGDKTTEDIQGVDKAALKTLLLHQQMGKARSAASDLFKSYEMKRIFGAIDIELGKKKLAIRGDRDLYSNLGHRKKITLLLLSYSTPWLRLGLETLFGVTILPEVPTQYSPTKRSDESSKNPAHQVRLALRNFIVNRVLFDEAVLSKYTKGRCKVPSGQFEKRYRAEMRDVVLKRLLYLIFFLDRAKQHNLLHDKATRLFTKAGSVKSSRDVLVSLCRDFLASEGDVNKHLGRVGLKVSYKQEPIDEIDMKITNFAIDLRDGVRLTKVAEILTNAGPNALLKLLRIPAVSRLQKLHNVGVSIRALRDAGVGVTADIAPHHIVDGHRTSVLRLMWAMISHYCFPAVLDFDKVEDEIQNLREEFERRKKLSGTANSLVDPEDETITNVASDIEDKGKATLLRWANAVCSLYGLVIKDFSDSFADGKALCFLVNYYHPRMLPMSAIRPTTRDLPSKKALSLDCARYNERLNSKLANTRLSELGGIPSMLPATDTTMVPDEKSMTVYLCYACSRLMTSRQEVRAIEKIQHQYRRFWLRRQRARKSMAALLILQAWRDGKEQYYLNQRRKYAAAVSKIEKFVCMRASTLKQLEANRLEREIIELSTTTIQCRFRIAQAKRCVRVLRSKAKVATNLQQIFRQRKAHRKVQTLRLCMNAAIQCQRLWRGYASRQETLVKLSSIILVQALARRKISRERFFASREAAVYIQRIWRGFWGQLQYQIFMLDIVAVQSVVRRRLAMKQSASSLQAVLVIQLAVRGWKARNVLARKLRAAKALQQGHDSATVCQRLVRGFLARRQTAALRLQFVAATIIQREWREYAIKVIQQRRWLAVVQIQSLVRAVAVNNEYKTKRMSATRIQSLWKKYWGNRKLQSAVLIQAQTRSWLARTLQQNRLRSLFVIQRNSRCWLAKRLVVRRRYLIRRVILCQSIVRRLFIQKQLRNMKKAATLVQSRWRASRQRSNYCSAFQLVLWCQARWRGKRMRERTSEMHVAAVLIQRVYRRHRAVQQLKRLDLSVLRVQTWWRSVLQLTSYRAIINGIIKAEALVRGSLARNKLRKETTVSEAIRFWKVTSRNLSHAAVILQKWWRARFQLTRFHKKQRLALTLTSLARGKLTRMQQSSLKCNAVKIQSIYRCHVATQIRNISLKAAVKIQSTWRTYQRISLYLDVQHSAKVIQSLVRQFIARRKTSQIIFLGAAKKSLLTRGAEISQSTRGAAMLIQSLWRKRMTLKAVVCLQAASRRFLARKQYKTLSHGISLFQCRIRGRSTRREFLSMRHDVILIQAHCRGVVARRQHCELLESKAATKLQCLARSWIAKRKMRDLRRRQAYTREAAAISLQRCYRSYCSRAFIKTLHSSAVSIQRYWRGFVCFIDFHMELSDIVTVQALARRWLAKRQVARRQGAIVCLQSIARMLGGKRRANIKRKKRQAIIRIQKSSLCIQRVFRGSLARSEAKMQRAARKIQTVWRAYTVHVDFLIALLGAITIQTQIRMFLAKQRLVRQKQAVINIQRIFRGFVQCFQYEVQVFAALRIQQITRKFLARHLLQERREEAAEERRRLRMPGAASIIQHGVRDFLARRAFHRLKRRVSLIQALCRGHIVRRRRKKRVRITAARLKEANLRATRTPNLRLGARTLMALHVLQTSRSLAEIMSALQTLEMSTRFSKVCCEAFAHAKATDILLSTIRQCNRSRPHIQLLIYIVRTLRNVAQHDSLLTYIATVPAGEVILDLVQSFRDKPEIFSTAACLVERMVLFDAEVEGLCKTQENRKRLKGIYNLCKRKSSSSIGRGGSRNSQRRSSTSSPCCGNPDMGEGINSLGRLVARIGN